MISAAEFVSVFGLPEIPIESETELAADWLLNHHNKEPSQRVRSALKSIGGTRSLRIITRHYCQQIRNDLGSLDLQNISHLAKMKEYFTFPLHYLNLDADELIPVTRTINSILKDKIHTMPKLTAADEEFLISLGWDTEEALKLSYETHLHNQVASFAGVWDISILDKLSNEELSRQELSKLRIREIFDIVINYPQSTPALQDLKYCIEPSQRANLVSSFTSSCLRRLLHAGANTNDIILCYTATIKSFLIVDPRGVLLDNASRPIRRYLKEREDTIPSIVRALLDEGPNDGLSKLAKELEQETERTVDTLTLDWAPDPIDALPDFKKLDIIESLISIFDPKDVFISELTKVFAKRLLSYKSYDISDMTIKLSQLKSKFEENDLNNLDVMVRDILESESSNSKIHYKNSDILDKFEFTILSYMYWPEFSEEEFTLPQVIEQQIALYQEEFKTLKQGRTVKWINHGVVTLELEFNNAVRKFEVSPDKATVISLFDDVNGLTLIDVCKKLEMSAGLAREALEFWVKNGVLSQEDGGIYAPIESQQLSAEHNAEGTTESAQNFITYERHWPFILGMLTNLGPMKIEKIQSFLNTIVAKDKTYAFTIDQLEAILNQAILEGRLEKLSTVYALKN